jgi:uroporphyrin-III C-methyltransferase/precorrin-2 dehydrogenase/sirohydrochlorin ferrochelatase
MNQLYPAFLKLVGRNVVLVGGGKVAKSKLEALAEAGARVTVVAPEVHPDIERAGVTVLRRSFEPSDLDGAWFVVAAAPPAVNRLVSQAADERRLFVNAVDDPANATAYLGGVLRRAGVTVAVSTDGRAPALAGLIREGLDALLPSNLGDWLQSAQELRRDWKTADVPMEERRPQLLEALAKLYERRTVDI